MFTGLIEQLCQVKSVRPAGGTVKLTIDLGPLAQDTAVGDSIAINGICLTISKLDGSVADFDVSAETLAKTNLTKLSSGSKINAERSLKASDRIGGHFVQGHIDGTVTIKSVKRQDNFATIAFTADEQILDLVIPKGSVAIDGISLTVAECINDGFAVAVIPQTLEKTTLGLARVGDIVNIETDIIVRTIKQYLEKLMPGGNTLTIEKLKQAGF